MWGTPAGRAAVDEGPENEQRDGREQPPGQGHLPAEESEAIAVVGVHEGDQGQHADGKVQQPLLEFAPWQVRPIVQVPRQHGGQRKKEVRAPFPGEGRHQQGHRGEHGDKDHTAAPCLALRDLAVHREGPAMVLRKPVPNESDEDRAENES